jgi:Alpha/beta hydrolase of unknown function (DUF900)
MLFGTALIVGLHFLQAQETAEPVQGGVDGTNMDWNSLSDFEVELRALEQTPPLAASRVPEFSSGGFYSAQHPEWPMLPADVINVPVWPLDSGVFVLSDLNYNYNQPVKAVAISQSNGMMQPMDGGPPVPGGGGSTNAGNGMPMGGTPINTNGLWLQITSVTNGLANLILHGTTNGIEYEILSEPALTNGTDVSSWNSEGMFLGNAATNWTTIAVPQNGRTNLFFDARSWQSSDGSGLPDWWELKYFGHTGVDPLADPDGDGFDNWEEFEMGTDPTVFNSPPPPQQFQAILNNNTTVTLTWKSSLNATGYTIWRYDTVLEQSDYFTVGATDQFVDTNFINYSLYDNPITYEIEANYTNGNSGWSAEISPLVLDGESAAFVALGSGGSTVLAATGIPVEASELEITRIDWNTNGQSIAGSTNFYVAASSFASAYTVPTNWIGLGRDGSSWYVQTVWSNGVTSSATSAGYLKAVSNPGDHDMPGRFNDASTQLVQNAAFLVRAAGLTNPFNYSLDGTDIQQPTDYSYASYFNVNQTTGDGLGMYYGLLDWNLPFELNYRYRNFVFSSTNIYAWGFLNTGCQGTYSLQDPLTFEIASTNTAALPAILSSSQTTWMVPYSDPTALEINTGNNQFSLPNNIYNYFGLKLLSVKIAHSHSGTLYLDTISAGGGGLSRTNDTYYFYPQFDQPEFETVGFYFGSAQYNFVQDSLPGVTGFSPTNAQPLMVATVGQPYQIAGFSKQIITNGNTNKPVYISQYFDKAYKVNASGGVTTNQTGILSPYGIFLPTEPGPTALVTLPDENGQRGTGIVQVVSLQLDANHDGVMESNYFGPDFTTGNSFLGVADKALKFWVNNDYDQPGGGTNLDQDLPVYENEGNYDNTNIMPNSLYGQIRCQRNLENFARLWINGLPNLATNQGYSIILYMDSQSGGAINLYQAYETNGGTGYLTDTNTAASQVSSPYGDSVAQLVPDFDSDYTLPVDGSGKPLITHFLFEGAMSDFWGDGTGPDQLIMEIYRNDQLLTQCSAYIDFSNARDMYERAIVTNVIQTWPEMVQQTNISGFQVLSTPPYNSYETNQLAVFVHGWRMTAWDVEDFSDIMFKRLYWQGYQGRLASLRWPTRSRDTDTNTYDLFGTQIPADTLTYNRSEHIAFESGTGAAAYFNNLRQRFTNDTISVCAHSQGNVVMMEALKELAASSQAPLDNYVMMQAAVPAHCYDTAAPNYYSFTNEEQTFPTPNTYSNYAANIDNALRGAGKIVNFFNTNDYALVSASTNAVFFGISFPITTSWIANEQLAKPLVYFGYSYNPANSTAYLTNVAYGVTGRTVTNLWELMPFVARPRSLAVGSLSGVGGMVNGGEFNLISIGFTKEAYDHSGEFNRNIQDTVVQSFYPQLRSKLFP